MAEQLSKIDTVTMEELIINHVLEITALVTILEKKGIINRTELLEEIRNLKTQ